MADDEIFAAIDIGTSAVRMAVGRRRPGGGLEVLSAAYEETRLGEGVFSRRRLSDEAVARTAGACRRLAAAAGARRARLCAAATAAVRAADNADETLALLSSACGVPVTLLDGRSEALILLRAVRRRAGSVTGHSLMLHPGAGSTQFVLAEGDEVLVCESLPLGTLRLTNTALPDGFDGPVDEARYALMRTEVRQIVLPLAARLNACGVDVAFGTSGVVRAFAAVAVAILPQVRRRSTEILWRHDLEAAVGMLCSVSLDERSRVPGLEAARADTIVAGGAMLTTLMETLHIDELQVPDVLFVRDGLLADFVESGGESPA